MGCYCHYVSPYYLCLRSRLGTGSPAVADAAPAQVRLSRALKNALLEQFMEIGGILKLGAFQ
jgi:hypothetical protein